jgi:hypothetical protein
MISELTCSTVERLPARAEDEAFHVLARLERLMEHQVAPWAPRGDDLLPTRRRTSRVRTQAKPAP